MLAVTYQFCASAVSVQAPTKARSVSGSRFPPKIDLFPISPLSSRQVRRTLPAYHHACQQVRTRTGDSAHACFPWGSHPVHDLQLIMSWSKQTLHRCGAVETVVGLLCVQTRAGPPADRPAGRARSVGNLTQAGRQGAGHQEADGSAKGRRYSTACQGSVERHGVSG